MVYYYHSLLKFRARILWFSFILSPQLRVRFEITVFILVLTLKGLTLNFWVVFIAFKLVDSSYLVRRSLFVNTVSQLIVFLIIVAFFTDTAIRFWIPSVIVKTFTAHDTRWENVKFWNFTFACLKVWRFRLSLCQAIMLFDHF